MFQLHVHQLSVIFEFTRLFNYIHIYLKNCGGEINAQV